MSNQDRPRTPSGDGIHIFSDFLDDRAVNSTVHAGTNPTADSSLSSAAVGQQPKHGGDHSTVTIGAIAVAIIATIAAVFFAFGGAQKLGLGSSVPMRATAIPEDFPAAESEKVPAAIASTLFSCEPGETNNGDKGDYTEGTGCQMAVNGELGQATFATDEEWIQRALDRRESLPEYRELEVDGYSAYAYRMDYDSGTTMQVTTLISDDKKFFMDFAPVGANADYDVSFIEAETFRNYLLDAIKP